MFIIIFIIIFIIMFIFYYIFIIMFIIMIMILGDNTVEKPTQWLEKRSRQRQIIHRRSLSTTSRIQSKRKRKMSVVVTAGSSHLHIACSKPNVEIMKSVDKMLRNAKQGISSSATPLTQQTLSMLQSIQHQFTKTGNANVHQSDTSNMIETFYHAAREKSAHHKETVNLLENILTERNTEIEEMTITIENIKSELNSIRNEYNHTQSRLHEEESNRIEKEEELSQALQNNVNLQSQNNHLMLDKDNLQKQYDETKEEMITLTFQLQRQVTRYKSLEGERNIILNKNNEMTKEMHMIENRILGTTGRSMIDVSKEIQTHVKDFQMKKDELTVREQEVRKRNQKNNIT